MYKGYRITKKYSEWMYHRVQRAYRKGDFQRVAPKINMLFISTYRRVFAYFDGDEPVAWLALDRRRNWKCWCVAQVYVQPEFRGQGIATKLYKVVVNDQRIVLATGISHTEYSMGLWRNFVKNKTFNIYAVDFKNLDLVADVVVVDDMLHSTLDVYHPYTEKKDVRLIALRKENGIRRSNTRSSIAGRVRDRERSVHQHR